MLKKKQAEHIVVLVVLLTIATQAVLVAGVIAGGLIFCKRWIR